MDVVWQRNVYKKVKKILKILKDKNCNGRYIFVLFYENIKIDTIHKINN